MNKSDKDKPRGILKAAGTVGGLTMVSRVLGLVRDILCATVFGSGAVWDSFVLAFTIPNLFRRLFGEGALTSAFLPVLVRVRKEEGEERAGEVTSSTITLLLSGLGLIAALIAAGCLVYLGYNGWDFSNHLTGGLLVIMIFYLPFICGAAVLGAALNSVRHFALPALAPVLLNIIWIAVMAVLMLTDIATPQRAYILAGGILLAGIAQFLIQVPVLRKHGLKLRPRLLQGDQAVKSVYMGMVPVMLALLVMQINVLADRLLAWWLIDGDGAISALFYGNRLMQFPLAVFGIAVGVAVFPTLREQEVSRQRKQMWQTLNFGIRLLIVLVLPSAAGLILIGRPVIDLFFNWGRFAGTPDAAGRTFMVLAAYSTGLLFFSLNILITKTYHSLDNRRFPAIVAGLMVAVNLGLNLVFLLLTPLREAGLALSTAITALLQVIVLTIVLVRKYGYDNIDSMVPSMIRSMIAVLIMGAVLMLVTGPPEIAVIAWGSSLSAKLLRVVTGVGLGVILYTASLLIMRSREAGEIMLLIRKRISHDR